mgnify:CR=1 FL=1
MRKLATIETIQEKKPIEGADKIEAVRVREWWVVAKKDEYEVGNARVYFEIDSFMDAKIVKVIQRPIPALFARGNSAEIEH